MLLPLPTQVMEEGTFTSDDGSLMQFGSAKVAAGGWTVIRFHGTGFPTDPATLTQIQTVSGGTCSAPSGGAHSPGWEEGHCEMPSESGGVMPGGVPAAGSGFLKTRQFTPTMYAESIGIFPVPTSTMQFDTQYFYCSLEDSSSRDGVGTMDVVPEMVGWAAFEAHHGTLGEMTFEAGSTPSWNYATSSFGSVGEQPYDIVFSGFFRSPPKMFGQISSYNGNDGAELRTPVDGINTISATVQIEEEQCTGEQSAVTGGVHGRHEVVDYFAILPGVGGDVLDGTGHSTNLFGRPVTVSLSASSNHAKAGETGHTAINADWITIALKSYYFRPVVIAGTPSVNGGDAVAVRIRNVRHGHGCAGWYGSHPMLPVLCQPFVGTCLLVAAVLSIHFLL